MWPLASEQNYKYVLSILKRVCMRKSPNTVNSSSGDIVGRPVAHGYYQPVKSATQPCMSRVWSVVVVDGQTMNQMNELVFSLREFTGFGILFSFLNHF